MKVILTIFLSILVFYPLNLNARKIKNTFRIDKEEKRATGTTSKQILDSKQISGLKIDMADTLTITDPQLRDIKDSLKRCRFAGYDKEPNSNKESFILVNDTENSITGYEIRIDYLDMQDRMLHSRTIAGPCKVPPGETRRYDIASWDTQHTFYYYLGNAPKRVATPFKVIFHPLSLWIEDESSKTE